MFRRTFAKSLIWPAPISRLPQTPIDRQTFASLAKPILLFTCFPSKTDLAASITLLCILRHRVFLYQPREHAIPPSFIRQFCYFSTEKGPVSTNQFNINFQNYSIFQSLEDHILFDRVPNVTFAVPRANAQNQHPAQMEQVQQSKFNSYRELILVDPIVENSDRLLAEGLESFADTIVEIYVLDAEQHGIAQISQLLSESDNQYDTVHIISDGAEGQITLGTSMLTCLLYTSPSPRDS